MGRLMPIILLVEILFITLFGDKLPPQLMSCLYAISLTIRQLLSYLLPAIIFGLIFKVTSSLARGAGQIIGVVLISVCCSIYLAAFLSHYVGEYVYHFDLSLVSNLSARTLAPLWDLHITLPHGISNGLALVSGLLLGLVGSFFAPTPSHRFGMVYGQLVEYLLNSFVMVIPFFVGGFIIKLQYEGIIETIVHDYSKILLVMVLAQFSYIVLMYLLANGFRLKRTIVSIKHMIPAVITGFSSMSSAAALPFTIVGVEKNSRSPELAASVLPATVNIHLLGDCIGIPIFAYAILKSFGVEQPDLLTYAIFTLHFVLVKLTAAGVPSGGIIVVLPILHYIGFNDTMTNMMFSIYALFDPILTSANVFANGAFAMIIDRVMFKFRKKRHLHVPYEHV